MKRLIPLLVTFAGIAVSMSQVQAAPSAVSGTLTFSGAIYLHTTLQSGDSVYCTVSLTEEGDQNGSNSEVAYIPAVLKSGSTYTCTVPIHYYWHLDTPASDLMAVTWTLGIGPSTGLTSTSQLVRAGTHTFPTVTGVPVSGTSWTMSDDAAL